MARKIVDGIEVKEQEEEILRLALQTLEELYCMNCFQLHTVCTCKNNETGVQQPLREKPVGEEEKES